MHGSLTRRELLEMTLAATGVAVAAGRVHAAAPKLAFSTLGCPKWPWRTILETAKREGYAGIELRGLMGDMDLPARPEFAGTAAASALGDVRALGLQIACVSSSAQLHHRDAATRAKHMDDAGRFIDLAHRLEAPYVRVFGDKLVPDEPKTATIERIASGMRELTAKAKGSGVEIIIESHGDFTDSATLAALLDAAPGSGLLWDAHHTVVAGGEAPADTFAKLGRFTRHTHLKDSVPKTAGSPPEERTYVLTGTGQVPVRDIVSTLVKGGYGGFLCFEWEKVWHPDIAEPEVAIPQFAKTVKGYL